MLSGTLEGSPSILGYYTLVMAAAEQKVVPREKRQGIPKQIPVALIARLAVEIHVQGQGVGTTLLHDALKRVHLASGIIGCYAAVVDAKDERAERFYKERGFKSMSTEGYPRRMCLGVDAIAQILVEAP